MCELIMFFYNGREHHCSRRVASLGKATVCGNLYLLPPDSPTLQVPNDSILLAGIKDAFESAQEQYQENNDMDFEYKIHDGWDTVHGELVTFYDPEKDIPELDKRYGAPFYFDRILIPARNADGSIIAAWAYVMHEIHFSARRLPDGIWPEKPLTQ
ncbi:MAG: gamma-glutamylcyclotransferase family protein [Victivallales bacterium]